MDNQPTTASLTILLPGSDHERRYCIQREQNRLVIKPEFTYELEELSYILWHLSSGKNLIKLERKKAWLSVPIRLHDRKEFFHLENQTSRLERQVNSLERRISKFEHQISKLESEESQERLIRKSRGKEKFIKILRKKRNSLNDIREKRTSLVTQVIREECQPLTNSTTAEREVFANLKPEEKHAFADYFLDLLDELAPRGTYNVGEPSFPLHWPDEAKHVVFAALNVFDLEALRLSTPAEHRLRFPPEPVLIPCDLTDENFLTKESILTEKEEDLPLLDRPLLDSLDRHEGLISEVIRDWQERAQSKDRNERHQAQDNLRHIGEALLPPTRGQGQKDIEVSALEVRQHYYKELFRCEQAAALLAKLSNLPGGRRWEPRLQAVCER